MTCKKFPQCK